MLILDALWTKCPLYGRLEGATSLFPALLCLQDAALRLYWCAHALQRKHHETTPTVYNLRTETGSRVIYRGLWRRSPAAPLDGLLNILTVATNGEASRFTAVPWEDVT